MTDLSPGALLRQRIADEYVANGYEPDGREAELIDRACATADLIAELEAVVEREGTTTLGSAKQTVIHPAVPELRQQRALLMRLLAGLDFGSDSTAAAVSSGARHAARARWSGPSRRWISG